MLALALAPGIAPRSTTSSLGHVNSPVPGKCDQLCDMLMDLERHKVDKVVPTIRRWIGKGNKIDSSVLDRVLVRLRSRKRYLQALMVLDWIANEKAITFGYHEAIQRLDVCSRCHHVTRTLLLFHGLPRQWKNEEAYCVLLTMYYKRNLLEDAERTMQELRLIGIKSMEPYHVMLSFYKLRGMETRFELMVEEIKSSGLAPDASFLSIVLAARDSFGGGLTAVEDVLAEMDESAVKLDAVACLELAGIYLKSGLRDKSEHVLKEMEKSLVSGEFKDLKSIRRKMMAAYGKLGNKDAIERMWNSLKYSKEVNMKDYARAIEAFGRVGRMDEAEKMYMRVGSSSSNPSIHNAFLTVLVNYGDLARAEALVERMKGVKCPWNALTYHLLIDVYLKAGKLDSALLALQGLRSAFRGLEWPRPLPETLATMVEFFVETGDVQASERLVKRWMEDGFPMSITVFNNLLKVYSKAGIAVHDFPGKMLSAGVEPTRETEKLFKEILVFASGNKGRNLST